MKQPGDQLDRLILRAVCQDIAPFEAIVDNLRRQLEDEELEHVAPRLLWLIKLRMVDSFLLHTEPPHLTPVDTDAIGIYRHWFFISQEGQNYLDQLRPLNGERSLPSRAESYLRPRREARNRKTVGC